MGVFAVLFGMSKTETTERQARSKIEAPNPPAININNIIMQYDIFKSQASCKEIHDEHNIKNASP